MSKKRLDQLARVREAQRRIARADHAAALATADAAALAVTTSKSNVAEIDAALRPTAGDVIDAARIAALLMGRAGAEASLRTAIVQRGTADAIAVRAASELHQRELAVRRIDQRKKEHALRAERAEDERLQTMADEAAARGERR